MSTSSLQQLVWILVSVLGHCTLITAAILLLRGRGVGPWLILIGSVIGLAGRIGGNILAIMATTHFPSSFQIMAAVSALGALGWLLACAGVLVLSFQHRALVTRSQELESILRAHQDNR